jgi:hypothetical protein
MSEQSQEVENVPTLTDRITVYVQEMNAKGEYATIRATAKALGVKQPEVRDNLPSGSKLEAGSNNTLSESRIILSSPKEEESESEDMQGLVREQEEQQQQFEDVPAEDVAQELADGAEEGTSPAAAVGEGDEGEEDTSPRAVCIICGNPVRRTTELIRGICPLCFRELARNSKLTRPKIMDISE